MPAPSCRFFPVRRLPALLPLLGSLGLCAATVPRFGPLRPAVSTLSIVTAAPIVAQPLPQPAIAGFAFPESESTLAGWVTAMTGSDPDSAAAAAANIYTHAWGLWTAATAETDQVYAGQTLRVFETWYAPEDLVGTPTVLPSASIALRRRAPLARLATTAAAGPAADQVVGYVKYDPDAAAHIAQQQLLSATSLNALLAGGSSGVPAFPATAVVSKSVFWLAPASAFVGGRYFRLPVWTGPPGLPQPWDSTHWTAYVWFDRYGGGLGAGAVDSLGAADGSSRTAATTYPLSSILNIQLSAPEAQALNADRPGTVANAGDTALLVGMHIAGREMTRWTWQTFWWAPDPLRPPAPSTAAIVAQRPVALTGAPAHYAMAVAYAMENPNQPFVGGENTGRAIYAYNPYVEAGFTPANLPDSQPGLALNGLPAVNDVGVQTNCMSCHARANFNPQKLATAPRQSGARYVDLADPQFVGTLQTDFLWSIPDDAH
jgi:hypothetical protein